LVPYDKAWRTGANGPTIITFGDEVTIGGKTITPGKYGFIAIPGKTSWTLVITKQLDIVSTADYKQENDIVRVSSKPETLSKPVETFSMQFENVSANRCELWLKWEKTAVVLPIKTDVDKKVMEGINKAMSENDPPYFQAAYYYFSNNKDMHKAEEWAKKATEKDPDAYYMYYLLAEIQAKNGEKEAAISSAKKSIELSKQNKRDDYIDLNNKLIKSLK
jgi:tetratricopeptide (TPR) repeat protein